MNERGMSYLCLEEAAKIFLEIGGEVMVGQRKIKCAKFEDDMILLAGNET